MSDKQDKPKKLRINKHNTRFEKNLSISQRRYLERQVGDPYVQMAKKEGYRSRAAYKMMHIQEKYNLVKPNMTVVDLGAAPGGWSQYLSRLFAGKIQIIALDKLPMEPIEHVTFIKGDFTDEDVEKELSEACPEGVDIVISDISPETIGHSKADHLRIMGLADLAVQFARDHLRAGGHFACKLFMGGEEKAFVDDLRRDFQKVSFFKPASSRKGSREIFIVAQNYFRKL